MRSHPLAGNPLPDNPDDGLLFRVIHYAAYAVACSYCKAVRGEDCFAKGKYTYALSFHKARVEAVEDLSPIEKYRAFAAVRAEAYEKRKRTDAVLARPLTAEEQATKAQIAAVFDQADEDFRAKERAMHQRCRQPWLHNEACYCAQGRPYVHPVPAPRVEREVTVLAEVRARKAGMR